MKKDTIKEVMKELYKQDEEFAIEIANTIFSIRDGDYDKPEFTYPLYVRDIEDGEIRKYTSESACTVIWSEDKEEIGHIMVDAFSHTHHIFEPIAFNEERQLWDKAIVKCWDDDSTYEIIRFYDAVNDCTFYHRGERDGPIYGNYEIVENPSARILELQKQLE